MSDGRLGNKFYKFLCDVGDIRSCSFEVDKSVNESSV